LRTDTRYVIALGVLAAVFLAAAAPSQAAEPTANALDKIVTVYQQNASKWESTLSNYALTLFWILAAIEFGVWAIGIAFRNVDLGEFLGELTKQILFIGFFLALLTNSSSWAKAIIDSFRQAANQAAQSAGGTSNISPSDIFAVGLLIANKVADQASIFAPGASVGLIIFALVLIVCFALIAAFMVLALVESYVIISAGVLLMGFGGSRWTKDYALKTLIYAVSVGAKLFILQLLVALGQQIFTRLAQAFEANSSDVFVVVGSAIVMLALVKIIPDMIQALINGASTGSTGGVLLGSAAGVAGTAWGATKGVYGTTMAVRSANRLASEQLSDSELRGTGGPGRLLRAGGNLIQAGFDTLGARLSGRAHFGTYPGQMSEILNEKTRDRQEERLRSGQGPSPGTPAGGSGPGSGGPGAPNPQAGAPSAGRRRPQGNP
jgi:type IV secretion system protein TrbL